MRALAASSVDPDPSADCKMMLGCQSDAVLASAGISAVVC